MQSVTHSQAVAMGTPVAGQCHSQARCAAGKAGMTLHRLRSFHSQRTLLTVEQPNIRQ